MVLLLVVTWGVLSDACAILTTSNWSTKCAFPKWARQCRQQCFSAMVLQHTRLLNDNVRCAMENCTILPKWSTKFKRNSCGLIQRPDVLSIPHCFAKGHFVISVVGGLPWDFFFQCKNMALLTIFFHLLRHYSQNFCPLYVDLSVEMSVPTTKHLDRNTVWNV